MNVYLLSSRIHLSLNGYEPPARKLTTRSDRARFLVVHL